MENQEKTVTCRTVLGTIRICRKLPYPCVPEPELTEKNGQILRIVTASYTFRLHGKETEDISPVLYQSCMHPEQIRIYPVELEFQDGQIIFRVKGRQRVLPEKEAASVEVLGWEAKLKKKSCVPCTNCGRCSW